MGDFLSATHSREILEEDASSAQGEEKTHLLSGVAIARMALACAVGDEAVREISKMQWDRGM